MTHLDWRSPRLVGRRRELDLLAGVVSHAVDDGAALLVTGEPGVGKSALLGAAAEIAGSRGVRVIRGSGVEYESDVGYAGLHQLVDLLSDELDQLPPARRATLQVALGIGTGPAPGRLAVLDAALALFRHAASRTPMLVVVDDMHWLDRASASVIGSVGRRLAGSHLGLLVGTRLGAGGFFEHAGWPELVVTPLDETESLELLTHQFAHLPTRVLREVAREAQGNPLALLEFAAAAGRSRAGDRWEIGAGRGVRTLFESRISQLPASTRRLLLLAALDGSGSLGVLASAGGPGGVEELGPAERDHLVVVDERVGEVRFRHPMVKSAVVELSTLEARREAHQRLAEIFVDHPERRGHHLAEAALAPDETVAAIVEKGARRTLRRGDVVGAVARLLRAADLSPGSADRGRRLAEAVFIGAFSTGELESSSQLLRDATRNDPTLAATLNAASATAYMLINSEGDIALAHRLLTEAIDSALAEPTHDRGALSRGLYTLVVMCHYARRADYWDAFDDIVQRVGAEVPADTLLLTETFASPLTASREALAELDREVDTLDDALDVGHIVQIATAAFYTDRLAGCRKALDRVTREGREGGLAASALMTSTMAAFDDLNAGRWDAAGEAASEARELSEQLGYRLYGWSANYASALVAGRRGDLVTCADLSEAMAAWGAARGLGSLEDFAHHAQGEAALGAGDFERAYAHASAITGPGTLPAHSPQALWSALDLVEAALHTGRTAEATAHAQAMHAVAMSRLSPRFALVTTAALAMVAADDAAPDLFVEALGHRGAEAWPFELARVHLAHGERLRRLRDTREARAHLQSALDGFDRLGAVRWAQRAATELRATGATRRPGGPGGASQLTPQELEVAQLAASGMSNRDIATRLYVSPRTVSAHLYRAFPKLGVTSRAALRDALGDASGDDAP